MADIVRVSDDTVIRKATPYEAWLNWQLEQAYGPERHIFLQDGIEYYIKEDGQS